MFKSFSVLFCKVKYRLLRLLMGALQRIYYLLNFKPCWCKRPHFGNQFARFKPMLQAVFAQLDGRGWLPKAYADAAQLQRLQAQLFAGQMQLFTAQLQPIGEPINWHCACVERCAHSLPTQFFVNWLASWQQQLKQRPMLAQDLRLIWEKNRWQWLLPLILCPPQSIAAGIELVAKVLTQWFEHNPFLTGPNWSCAMETAIRAINGVWLATMLPLSTALQEKLQQQLCLHAFHIVANLETFDRPNNHLLADLLGMLYLTAFWQDETQFLYYQNYFDQALVKQVNPDGSSYEGATRYHYLVLEMLMHRILLAQALGLQVSAATLALLAKMQQFAAATPAMVGDDDGGKLLFGVLVPPQKSLIKQAFFQDFGLWVGRQQQLCLTFNVRPRNCSQPSGHRHFDCLSLQLHVEQEPWLTDAGTGCYTGLVSLRQFLRGFGGQSSFFPLSFCQLSAQQPIFSWPQSCSAAQLQPQAAGVFGQCSWQGITRNRQVNWLAIKGVVRGFEVIDTLDYAGQLPAQPWFWQWCLAPDKRLVRLNEQQWLIIGASGRWLCTSNLNLQAKQSLFAPQYGQFVSNLALRARLVPEQGARFCTRFEQL